MSFTKKNLEQLPPSEISQQLRERVAQLNALLDLKFRALKNAPEGSLRISQCRGDVQYYHRITPDDERGHYIDAAHYELAQGLVQKDYNQRLVKSLKKEIKILQGALCQLEKITASNDVINLLHPLRRALITPATLSDSQYATVWLSQKYKGKSSQPDSPELYTARGERVRSKSEVIIADTLARLGVPYRYEFPLTLNGGGRAINSQDGSIPRHTATSRDIYNSHRASHHSTFTVHPDFLCLNLRTRQEFIWEHFGLMDDPDYAEKAVQKLNSYNENAIFPGHNLIITTESVSVPLNIKHIERLIQKFLK